MPTTFPYPPSNMTSIFDLLSHANVLTDGFLGTGILIVVAVISLISAKAFSSDKAFGFAAFLSLITAILLRFMGLINDAVLYITIVAFVAVLIWVYSIREQETV